MKNHTTPILIHALAYWRTIVAVSLAITFSIYVNAHVALIFINTLGASLIFAKSEPDYDKAFIIFFRIVIVANATIIAATFPSTQ